MTWRRYLNILGPFIGLALVIGIFSLLPQSRESFLTLRNFKTVGTQTIIVGIGALGMTMIIIGGGIDLSVGSVIALSGVASAVSLLHGWPPVAAIAAGVLTGGIIGCINGALITSLRMVPFIVTLGMMGIARGLAKWLGSEQTVTPPPTWINKLAMTTPEPAWLVLAPGLWVLIILAIAMALVLTKTVFGRYVFAIGSNEAATYLAGINVNRMKLAIYSLAGLFTGLAGVMQMSRLTQGDPTVAIGAELDIIAAVVIGGGSLSGGEGSILGSMIGALIMSFLKAGCQQMGWPNYIQEIIIGTIIVVAVALDRLRHRRA